MVSMPPVNTGGQDHFLQFRIRLGAHEPLIVQDKCGHRSDCHLTRSIPVVVNGLPIGSLVKHPFCRIRIKPHGFAYIEQNGWVGNVLAAVEIRQKGGMVEGVAHLFTLIFGPFTQFLGQPAIVGFGALTKRQTQFMGDLAQVGQQGRDVHRLPGKQIFEALSRFRCLRMQGIGDPFDSDIKARFELFNTPGTEVAPRSDVVGEDC